MDKRDKRFDKPTHGQLIGKAALHSKKPAAPKFHGCLGDILFRDVDSGAEQMPSFVRAANAVSAELPSRTVVLLAWRAPDRISASHHCVSMLSSDPLPGESEEKTARRIVEEYTEGLFNTTFSKIAGNVWLAREFTPGEFLLIGERKELTEILESVSTLAPSRRAAL